MRDLSPLWYLINTIPSSVNSWLWEGRSMENDKPYDSYAKDAGIKEDYLKENHVLKNERSMRGDNLDRNQGARLRMDAENQSCEITPLETIEQEKNRLSRKLAETIRYNDNVIQTLSEMLQRTEIYQKRSITLMQELNRASSLQMDQVHQLREHLK